MSRNKPFPPTSPGVGGHLLDGILPYDRFRDQDGSEVVTTRLPSRVVQMVDDLLALRKVPMRNRSELVRAALFHYLQHAVDLSENADLVLGWLAIEEAARAARWDMEHTQDAQIIENVATSVRYAMEAGVKDGPEVISVLERFLRPILGLPADNLHRKRLVRLAAAHPNVWRAMQDTAGRSLLIHQACEER